jgi:hypothetical protein
MTAGAKPYTMKVVRTVFNGGHEETYGNASNSRRGLKCLNFNALFFELS